MWVRSNGCSWSHIYSYLKTDYSCSEMATHKTIMMCAGIVGSVLLVTMSVIPFATLANKDAVQAPVAAQCVCQSEYHAKLGYHARLGGLL